MSPARRTLDQLDSRLFAYGRSVSRVVVVVWIHLTAVIARISPPLTPSSRVSGAARLLSVTTGRSKPAWPELAATGTFNQAFRWASGVGFHRDDVSNGTCQRLYRATRRLSSMTVQSRTSYISRHLNISRYVNLIVTYNRNKLLLRQLLVHLRRLFLCFLRSTGM